MVGFEASDLVIDNGEAGPLLGQDEVYETTVWPAATGTVTIDVPEGVAEDAWGNPDRTAERLEVEALLTTGPALPTAWLAALAGRLGCIGIRHRSHKSGARR